MLYSPENSWLNALWHFHSRHETEGKTTRGLGQSRVRDKQRDEVDSFRAVGCALSGHKEHAKHSDATVVKCEGIHSHSKWRTEMIYRDFTEVIKKGKNNRAWAQWFLHSKTSRRKLAKRTYCWSIISSGKQKVSPKLYLSTFSQLGFALTANVQLRYFKVKWKCYFRTSVKVVEEKKVVMVSSLNVTSHICSLCSVNV